MSQRDGGVRDAFRSLTRGVRFRSGGPSGEAQEFFQQARPKQFAGRGSATLPASLDFFKSGDGGDDKGGDGSTAAAKSQNGELSFIFFFFFFFFFSLAMRVCQ